MSIMDDLYKKWGGPLTGHFSAPFLRFNCGVDFDCSSPFDGIKAKWDSSNGQKEPRSYYSSISNGATMDTAVCLFVVSGEENYTLMVGSHARHKGTLRECLEYYDKHFYKEEEDMIGFNADGLCGILNESEIKIKYDWTRLSANLWVHDAGTQCYSIKRTDTYDKWALSKCFKNCIFASDPVFFSGSLVECVEFFNNHYKEGNMEEHKCSKDDDCRKETSHPIQWDFKSDNVFQITTSTGYAVYKDYVIFRNYFVDKYRLINVRTTGDTIFESDKAHQVFKFAEKYITERANSDLEKANALEKEADALKQQAAALRMKLA